MASELQCKHTRRTGTITMHRCERPAVKDGYCTRHHPSYLSPKEKKALAKFDATRPTPVAPVSPDATGKCGELETVGYVHEEGLKRLREMRRSTHVVGFINDIMTIPLCLRSQAVELLAAKDADINRVLADNRRCLVRIAELEADAIGYRSTIEHLTHRAETAEADNAALTARVKELDRCHEGTIDLCNQKTAEIKTLEAKLAAAEKALEPFAEHANDRAVDDTGWRDKETVMIVVSIGALRKARAALGGKPS
ncbi:hypothetical protein [Brucella anthropi]|uniref:hypothetical protein n=1 Tax=Brucella anthropi TaxID=529 RepID=UPI001CFC653B|nr:hypothetical protein [Brucella anthropi]